MTPSPRAAVASLLAGAMLLGACADAEPEPESLAQSQAQRGVFHGTHGLFVTRQLDEYVKASDVIVVGKVTSKKERADQRDGEWKDTIWEDVSVQVEETIVGDDDPVDALTVRRRLESGRVQFPARSSRATLRLANAI